MTDNEIVKALECCVSHKDCDDSCPCVISKTPCVVNKPGTLLNLINRQKEEIENLKNEKEEMHKDVIAAEEYAWNLKKEKIEAIRKFAKKVKAVTYNYYDEDIDIIAKEMEKQNDC